jgi:hypothetical protein
LPAVHPLFFDAFYIYSLPPETHAAFTRWSAPLNEMCRWWRDGDTVLPQLTFKGANLF